MKRKMFFRLAVTCLVAVSALIACTKDYESDIKALQNKVDDLSKQVEGLDKLIKDGYVITDVSSITGGTRVTLSNGKTFDVTNGIDGNDGENGKDGTTWKIGDNGNWWADKGDGNGFVDSGKPSRGVQGPQGDQGLQGVGIANAVLNDDYTLTITLTDGTIFKTASIRGAEGPQGLPGEQGPQGVGIANAVLNDDYTLTLTFTDGTSTTTSSIRGAQGPQGEQGPQGVGIESTVLNDDYTLTITYTDGTSYTTPSIRGAKGEKGTNGDYYKPCTEKGNENYGKWIKVNGETLDETPLDDEWLPKGTLTAVWDESTNTLTIANVEGRDEDDPIVIDLNLGLNSLALIPELWDAKLGMPTTQVYAITPSAWETARAIFGKTGVLPRFLEWFSQQGGAGLNGTWAPFDPKQSPALWNYQFWCTLYNSYIGVTNQKNAQGVSYDSHFDVYSQDFNYWWEDHNLDASYNYELTYADFANAVKEMIDLMSDRLRNIGNMEVNFTRQPPVSDLNLKYRINPAGADLTGYKFSMLDRTLQVVNTKADGDHRGEAVVIKSDGVKKSGKDQLNVTGYMNYFKYWADKPADWFIMIMTTKAALAWDYWQQNLMYNAVPNAQYAATAQNMGQYTNSGAYGVPATNNFTPAYNAMRDWLKAQGIEYETILALEAAKNNRGDEAIVSDYTAVKLNFVTPIWTAYNVHKRYDGHYATTGLWPIAPNMAQFQLWDNFPAAISQQLGGLDPREYFNDKLEVGKEYDVASHMRFADPYYGRLEDLGFHVQYSYYVYEAANSGTHDYWATWADGDDNPKGETETNYGAWDKVNCTLDGKVTVKTDENGKAVSGAVGKYVIITADAAIENKATNTLYNSSTRGATGGVTYMGCNVDEFTGHYVLFIIPNPEDDVFIPKDLGEIDYLALPESGIFNVPTSLVYEDERVNMDLDGFQRVYEMTGKTLPKGVSLTWTATGGFQITIDNTVDLGAITPDQKLFTVIFAPKAEFANQNFPNICVSFGYNVTIDWTDAEPILNDNYILFDEEPQVDPDNIARFVRGTGVLAKTDITPDPATKYAQPNRIDDAFDTTKFPYVDSIVTVKGKEVDGIWKPQSSIKEHIREYGSYLAAQPNIANMSMVINFPNSQKEDGAEIILRDSGMGDSYANQDIKLSKPFAMGEQSRDYVVDIKVTLANGAEKVVKAYIVRFICPFYIDIEDEIELFTHTADWCSDRVLFTIRETGTNELLVFWDPYGFAQHVTPYAQRTYGSDVFSSNSLNAPKWHSLADTSFGNRLLYGENSGWFYWCNMGTDLQFDKSTTYKVTQEIAGLAYLTGEGKILIHKTADSPAAHINEGHGPEIEPTQDAHPTWEIIFDNE